MKLDCGTFYIDQIEFEGPPNICIIKATSIPVSGSFKGVRKSAAFENSTLRDIVAKLAGNSGFGIDYRASVNPSIKRIDQDEESDAYISRLCTNFGLSTKFQDRKVIIFDEAEYDQQ